MSLFVPTQFVSLFSVIKVSFHFFFDAMIDELNLLHVVQEPEVVVLICEEKEKEKEFLIALSQVYLFLLFTYCYVSFNKLPNELDWMTCNLLYPF